MVEFFAHITHEENSVTRPKHCYELHLLHTTHKAKLTQNRPEIKIELWEKTFTFMKAFKKWDWWILFYSIWLLIKVSIVIHGRFFFALAKCVTLNDPLLLIPKDLKSKDTSKRHDILCYVMGWFLRHSPHEIIGSLSLVI